MAEVHIDMGHVANEIGRQLLGYSNEIKQGVIKLAKKAAKNTTKDLETDSPKDRGEYARKWKTKTTNLSDGVECTIYNQLYGLTHLLENGHALRQGGRAPSAPHIQKNEQKANKDFEEGCKEIINNAGY